MDNQFVRPIIINSPYSNHPVRPRTRTFQDRGHIVEEAIWVCPSTGMTFKRGIVSKTPVEK